MAAGAMPHPALALTPKQRAFVEYYINSGGNAREAAERAYDCSNRNSARVLAHRNLHNSLFNNYLHHLMEQRNIPEKVVESLKEQLQATKWVQVKGELIEVPDNEARHKAQELVLKVFDF